MPWMCQAIYGTTESGRFFPETQVLNYGKSFGNGLLCKRLFVLEAFLRLDHRF